MRDLSPRSKNSKSTNQKDVFFTYFAVVFYMFSLRDLIDFSEARCNEIFLYLTTSSMQISLYFLVNLWQLWLVLNFKRGDNSLTDDTGSFSLELNFFFFFFGIKVLKNLFFYPSFSFIPNF